MGFEKPPTKKQLDERLTGEIELVKKNYFSYRKSHVY